MTAEQPGLARRLGVGDATFIGLGSMIGAGVFAAFTPAAQAAGAGMLVGLVVAAIVAFCNATASAQLAAVYPASGGTYVYGRERLGPWWGFLAGWSFVIGKTASCAAMALTFAAYAAPAGWERRSRSAAVVAPGRGQLPRSHAHGTAHPGDRGGRAARAGRRRRGGIGTGLPASARIEPLDVARGRLVRHPAIGGPAVLRLRRLRPHRDDGRGGPRPGTHHPARDPARVDPGGRRLRRHRRGDSRHARRRRRGRFADPAVRHRRGGRLGLGRTPRAIRRGGRVARGPARPDRRASGARPWRWPEKATCPAGWLRCIRGSSSAPGRGRARRRRSCCSCSPSTCAARSGSPRSACCSTTSSRTWRHSGNPPQTVATPGRCRCSARSPARILVVTLPLASSAVGLAVLAGGRDLSDAAAPAAPRNLRPVRRLVARAHLGRSRESGNTAQNAPELDRS